MAKVVNMQHSAVATVVPGSEALEVSLSANGVPWHEISGEYSYIDGVMHALYRYRGVLWLRIGVRDIPLREWPMVEWSSKNGVAKLQVTLSGDVSIVVQESCATVRMPEQYDNDNEYDFDAILWTHCVASALRTPESMRNYWGFSGYE